MKTLIYHFNKVHNFQLLVIWLLNTSHNMYSWLVGRYRRSADEDEDDNDEDDVSSNRAKVSAIDILSEENSRQHHTEKYDVVQGGGLVVRRGQAFNLLLQFDRRFSLKKNTLRLVFKTGIVPQQHDCIDNMTSEHAYPKKSNWWSLIWNKTSYSRTSIYVYYA